MLILDAWGVAYASLPDFAEAVAASHSYHVRRGEDRQSTSWRVFSASGRCIGRAVWCAGIVRITIHRRAVILRESDGVWQEVSNAHP